MRERQPNFHYNWASDWNILAAFKRETERREFEISWVKREERQSLPMSAIFLNWGKSDRDEDKTRDGGSARSGTSLH